MRISWLTPLETNRTEIARYSKNLIPHLKKYIRLAEVTDCSDREVNHDWLSSVSEGESFSADDEGSFDDSTPVYNMGNNALHVDIATKQSETPGFVVLHDICLLDLAKAYSLKKNDFEWLEALDEVYGFEALVLAKENDSSFESYERLASEYPLFQPFIRNALGVIVHSEYAQNIVMQYYKGPVLKLDLPYPVSTIRELKPHKVDVCNMIFCGHLGPNRRIENFLKAWGEVSCPDKFRFKICGDVGNKNELFRVAEEAGVSEWLEIMGYVSSSELDTLLLNADLAINLRYPTMGESSASQLRYWDNALPALVSSVGWYKEVPDDTVIKISINNEIADIRAALENINEKPEEFASIGNKGYEYLKSNHSPDEYAKEITSFIEEVKNNRLYYNLLTTDIVEIIADMCEQPESASLFEPAVELFIEALSHEG